MVEFAILALLNRMVSWGRAPVIATRIIAADAATLRALVSDPASQWRIVHGVSPLLRPRAHVETNRFPRLVAVRVRFGRRDVLWITWILTPSPGTTEVDLVAQIESRGILARLVLLLGGRRWLRHRLETRLADLAALAHCAAEDLDDVARDADFTQTIPRKGATA
ncbi:MAG: hypothetical protein ACRDKY_12710 [Solirubrobacteraceae bacterium]